MAAERLRVLMTADTLGGVWPFAMELCAQLSACGDRVLLAAMGREPDQAQRAQAEAIPGLTLDARPYRLVWMPDPWRDLREAGEWLHALARGFRPDVVHLNDLSHAQLRWTAPVVLTAHSCVCSWWRAVHGEAAPSAWNRYRRTVAATLHAADRVVTPSRAMLTALMREHGALASTLVVHNGRGAIAGETAKEPFVFAAGRLWDEAKNLSTLAAVASGLPWPVHIAGDARHPGDGSDAAFGGVHALGKLDSDEVRKQMAHASIYALPARYEPFGLSVLEAAQAGCALVLGDIPSLREVWGDAALFVPPDEAGLLETSLIKLIRDDALRQDFATRARLHAARYTPEAMAMRYRAAYIELIARHRTDTRLIMPEAANAGVHP